MEEQRRFPLLQIVTRSRGPGRTRGIRADGTDLPGYTRTYLTTSSYFRRI